MRLKSRARLLRELNARLRNEDFILEVIWSYRRLLSWGGPNETNIYILNYTKQKFITLFPKFIYIQKV